NFERFLYYHCNEDPKKTASQMAKIAKTGKLKLPDFDADIFTATRCSDEDILANIQRVKEDYSYVVDPHTACAFQEVDPDRTTVVLGTASPAKFPDVIKKAIGETPTDPLLEVLKKRKQVRYPVDANADAVRQFIEAHSA
ncbi:MAG: threonine synthase, partial [Verrucomicrobiae bacterium]|nr:threonine synthase [Verrucomicrobiae bacterium]